MLGPLEIMLAIEEIKQLKARYFRDLDTKNWVDLATVFTSDANFDLRRVNSMQHPLTKEWIPPPAGDNMIFTGRDTIVELIRASIENLYTIHHGHMPEITILDHKSATGIWPMEDILRRATGELFLHGSGYYHEIYENAGAGWRIKTSRLERIFIVGALEAGLPNGSATANN